MCCCGEQAVESLTVEVLFDENKRTLARLLKKVFMSD